MITFKMRLRFEYLGPHFKLKKLKIFWFKYQV